MPQSITNNVQYYPPLPNSYINRHLVVRGEDSLVINFSSSNRLSIHASTSNPSRMQAIVARINQLSPYFWHNSILIPFIMNLQPAGSEDFERENIAAVRHFDFGETAIIDFINLINDFVFENTIPAQTLAALNQVTGCTSTVTAMDIEGEDIDMRAMNSLSLS